MREENCLHLVKNVIWYHRQLLSLATPLDMDRNVPRLTIAVISLWSILSSHDHVELILAISNLLSVSIPGNGMGMHVV